MPEARTAAPIAFVDTETTHLDAEIGEAWEVAVILREQDGEHTTDTEYAWRIRPDLISFDPEALRIGRFEERFAVPPGAGAAFTAHESGHVTPMTRAEAVVAITNVLSGAVLVGSNPGFDDRHLRKLLGLGNAQWHYRPYDIVQLAAAKIGVQAAGPLPWSSYALSRAVGVEPPDKDAAHTALGDARWARDVFDAVMTSPEKFPMSWEGRAKHAIGLYTRTVIELEDARRDLRRTKTELAEEKARHDPRLRCLLIKTAPDRDQYVGWSTSCDMPAGVWSRETALEYGFPTSRLDRADKNGSSATNGYTAGYWDDTGFIAEQRGWLKRERLADYAVEYLLGDRQAAYALLEPLDSEPADGPSQPVTTDPAAVCTCTFGEPCGCNSMEPDDDQDDDEPEEFDEDGDCDGDVFELISEIAGRLRDATDSGEYHAVGLIYDLANGRTTIADARAELADIEFGHV